jgi:hypothetical protein
VNRTLGERGTGVEIVGAKDWRIRRSIGTAPVRKMPAVLEMRYIAPAGAIGVKDLRDRALLLWVSAGPRALRTRSTSLVKFECRRL